MNRRLVALTLFLMTLSGCSYSVYSHTGNVTRQDLLRERPRYPLKASLSINGLYADERQMVLKSLQASNLFSDIRIGDPVSDTDVTISARNPVCRGRLEYDDWVIYSIMVSQVFTWLPYLTAGAVPNPIPKRCERTVSFKYKLLKPTADPAVKQFSDEYKYSYPFKELNFNVGWIKPLLTSEKRHAYQTEKVIDQAVAGLVWNIQRNTAIMEP